MIKSGNIICSRQDKIYTPGHVKMFHESITFRILRSIQPELNKSARSKAYLVINRLPDKLTQFHHDSTWYMYICLVKMLSWFIIVIKQSPSLQFLMTRGNNIWKIRKKLLQIEDYHSLLWAEATAFKNRWYMIRIL